MPPIPRVRFSPIQALHHPAKEKDPRIDVTVNKQSRKFVAGWPGCMDIAGVPASLVWAVRVSGEQLHFPAIERPCTLLARAWTSSEGVPPRP
jgi:hypothetical protein